ncbi:hypothetical protein ABET23_11130 [Bacillus wiedmannii]|uniref:hypothetical protein n=1 Tax=Bacillus wiedmannii TaxID=1890302 RepID=UPI003D1F8354
MEEKKNFETENIESEEMYNSMSPELKIYERMERMYNSMQSALQMYERMEKAYNSMQPAALQMYERMEKTYDSMQPALQMYERMEKTYNSMELTLQMYERMEKTYNSMQPALQMYERIQSAINKFNTIDWNSIRDLVADQIKETGELLLKQEADFWCLDIDILNDINDKDLTADTLSEYVEKNLEVYIEEIIRNPMYELHMTLIKETYEAYKGGFYKLCVMPLFAAFEHVLSSWYAGTIKKDMVSVKHKPKVYRLYNNIKPEEYTEIEQRHLINVFVLSILRTYKNTFVKIPDELCQELNRNSIAHGFHDYNSITKVDVLKLFQLLKSALILKSVDSKEFKE